MSQAVRSAIIGTGFIGRVHARAVRAAGGELVAVAAATEAEAREAATALGVDKGTEDWREVVEDPQVDLVHVCTPNHLHAAIASAAIAAGKHVVCEKPLATSVESARALTTQAAEAGVVAAVPFAYRFYPTVRDARERIRTGQAGTLRLVHGSYLQDWLSRPEDVNWRVDPDVGGRSRAFGDIGVHWCDLVEFVTGQRIVRLSSRVFRVDRPGGASPTEDGAVMNFETDAGVLGSVVVSQVSPGRKNRLWFSVDGERASLQFDQENPDQLWIGGREINAIALRGSEGSSPAAARYSVLPVGHPMGFQDCFTAFITDVHAAIAGDPIDGLPTFADGLRAAVLTRAVLDAAQKETWLEVAP